MDQGIRITRTAHGCRDSFMAPPGGETLQSPSGRAVPPQPHTTSHPWAKGLNSPLQLCLWLRKECMVCIPPLSRASAPDSAPCLLGGHFHSRTADSETCTQANKILWHTVPGRCHPLSSSIPQVQTATSRNANHWKSLSLPYAYLDGNMEDMLIQNADMGKTGNLYNKQDQNQTRRQI